MQKTIMICDRCQSMYDKHENKVKSVTVSFPHGAEVPASCDRCFSQDLCPSCQNALAGLMKAFMTGCPAKTTEQPSIH